MIARRALYIFTAALMLGALGACMDSTGPKDPVVAPVPVVHVKPYSLVSFTFSAPDTLNIGSEDGFYVDLMLAGSPDSIPPQRFTLSYDSTVVGVTLVNSVRTNVTNAHGDFTTFQQEFHVVTRGIGTTNIVAKSPLLPDSAMRTITVNHPPPVVLFYAEQDQLFYGNTTHLRWIAVGAVSCRAWGDDPRWQGPVDLTGSLTIQPLPVNRNTFYNYYLTCSNGDSNGDFTKVVSVYVY